QLIEQYKLARATLQKEIAKAKAGAFKELLTSIDEDPWGMAYRIVYKRIKATGGKGQLGRETMLRIVEELFPKQTTLWQPAQITTGEQFPRITPEEVVSAAKRIRPSKAPGLDGIP
ncbi:hypothetical protein KR018_008025, partial [Drosophila ironensis]